MRFEEDQEGRVGLFASGSLPFSSCTGRVPEGTVRRGGAAALLVSRAAAAVNPGKPSGGHGNNSAEIELVNSRQNEREIDGLGDEQRWAKLQQDRRHHFSRNNTNQVAEADGCNAAASPLSLVTGQQGNPNMTSLISASTTPATTSITDYSSLGSVKLHCPVTVTMTMRAGRMTHLWAIQLRAFPWILGSQPHWAQPWIHERILRPSW